jgi:hypothetical protein
VCVIDVLINAQSQRRRVEHHTSRLSLSPSGHCIAGVAIHGTPARQCTGNTIYTCKLMFVVL